MKPLLAARSCDVNLVLTFFHQHVRLTDHFEEMT
jgi:hypothetical protein